MRAVGSIASDEGWASAWFRDAAPVAADPAMLLRLDLRRPAATSTATAATPSPKPASPLANLSGEVAKFGLGLGGSNPVAGATGTFSACGASAREVTGREGGSTKAEAAPVVKAPIALVAGCCASVTSSAGLRVAEAGMGPGATAIVFGGLASR